MKSKRATISTVAVLMLYLFAGTMAWAGPVETQVKATMDQLASKAQECRAIVLDALGTPFEEQIAKAMADLKKDPRVLKRQIRIIDILMAQASRLSGSLKKTKDADLAAMRDRVVKGLESLVRAKTNEKDRYLRRAKEAKDREWSQRYEELAQVCDRLARAYSLRAEQYKAVPITRQLVQVQLSLEYLDSVKGVLSSLRAAIATILSDEEALVELQQLTTTVDGIQRSLKTFSEVVLAGALAGDDQPADTSDRSKNRS